MSAITAVNMPAATAAMISFGHVRLIPPNSFLIAFVVVITSSYPVLSNYFLILYHKNIWFSIYL